MQCLLSAKIIVCSKCIRPKESHISETVSCVIIVAGFRFGFRFRLFVIWYWFRFWFWSLIRLLYRWSYRSLARGVFLGEVAFSVVRSVPRRGGDVCRWWMNYFVNDCTALWREAGVLGEVAFSVVRGVSRWDQVVRRWWRIRWTVTTLCWEASIVGSLVPSSDVSHGETLICRWWTE